MARLKENHISFFFLLSGENPELAFYELECVLSIYLDGKDIELSINDDYRIFTIKFPPKVDRSSIIQKIEKITHRTTMVHFSCELLFQESFTKPPCDLSELKQLIPGGIFSVLNNTKSFAVISKRVGEPKGIFENNWVSLELSKYLGSLIQQLYPEKQVKLTHPEERIVVLLNQHGIWIGNHAFQSLRDEVRGRTARNRPFFHPSSMNPILQRTLINLSMVRNNEWLLDPFCGSGGALLEAARLDIRCIGVEIDRRIIWGSRQNLQSDIETFQKTHLIFGDSRNLPIKPSLISGIVTDPPYGTASSTQGFDLSELLLEFFQEISKIMTSGKRIVMAVPSNLDIENHVANILDASFRVFYQYVHRSLTRKILVFILN